MSKNLQLR